MALDVAARGNDATALAIRLVGPEPLGRLVQVMLDHEVPPVFMWRGIAGPVEDEAQAVRSRLASALNSPEVREQVRVVVQGIPGLEMDMAKALLQLATSSGRAERESGFPTPTGRKRTVELDPTLRADLEALIEPVSRGDPEPPMRWIPSPAPNPTSELRETV